MIPNPAPLDVGRRQRQIMEIIYACGEGSVADVLAELRDPPTYSAVRTMLNTLEEKGHLRHRAAGRKFLYSPTVSRANAQRSALKNLLSTFFNGSVAQAVASLIELDANAEFEAGWRAATNPNGPWSYGWSAGLTGPLKLFTRHHVAAVNNNLEHMWDDPSYSIGFTPSVARNSAGDFNDGNVVFDAGALILHPGPSPGPPGTYTHVIWTAPQAGVYSLTSTWFSQQNDINVDAYIVVKGIVLFSKIIINGSIKLAHTFSGNFALLAGETIDFAAGPNRRYALHPGNIGVEAKIVQKHPDAVPDWPILHDDPQIVA